MLTPGGDLRFRQPSDQDTKDAAPSAGHWPPAFLDLVLFSHLTMFITKCSAVPPAPGEARKKAITGAYAQ